MAEKDRNLPDISFGEAGKVPPPDAEIDEEDDEAPTPPDVTAILGFDPDDEDE